MQAFPCTYYDGQSAQPHAAEVSLASDKITISLKDADGNSRIIYWYWEHVRSEAFLYGDVAVVKYNGFPFQTIEVHSHGFAEALQALLQQKGKPNLINRFLHLSPLPLMVLLATLVGLVALVYFLVIPFAAVRLAERLPVSYEERLGNSLYQSLSAGFKVDQHKTVLVNEFFRRMQVTTPYAVQITVVREDVANAFALPGGRIVVYDEILREMKNYDELAALLSHELAHVQLKHTTKSIFRSMGSYFLISVLLGDVNGISALVVQHANSLKNLQYSRRLEKEADLFGLKLLARRQIDGNGFVRLFESLKKQKDIPVSEWLSSHPDLDNRISYLVKDPSFNSQGVSAHPALQEIWVQLQQH